MRFRQLALSGAKGTVGVLPALVQCDTAPRLVDNSSLALARLLDLPGPWPST